MESWTRVNPAEYRTTFDAAGPYILLLGESYDHRWVGSADGAELTHFQANGFQNAYLGEAEGQTEVVIRHAGQATRTGILIATAGVWGLTGLLAASLWWRARGTIRPGEGGKRAALR